MSVSYIYLEAFWQGDVRKAKDKIQDIRKYQKMGNMAVDSIGPYADAKLGPYKQFGKKMAKDLAKDIPMSGGIIDKTDKLLNHQTIKKLGNEYANKEVRKQEEIIRGARRKQIGTAAAVGVGISGLAAGAYALKKRRDRKAEEEERRRQEEMFQTGKVVPYKRRSR